MNKDNVQIAINIMERAGKLDMRDWQDRPVECSIIKSEKELHSCGMPACFGGWVAISPEWKAYGGEITEYGAPIFGEGLVGSDAIAEWLGIDRDASKCLCYVDHGGAFHFYGGLYCKEVTKELVIEKLKELL